MSPTDRLLALLVGIGLEPDSRDVADLLWLAQHVETDDAGPASPAVVRATAGSADYERLAPELEPAPADGPLRPPRPAAGNAVEPSEAEVHVDDAATGPGDRSAPILMPIPPMLAERLNVQRSLRPLKRTVAHRQDSVVDEEATTHRTADRWATVARDTIQVALRPAAERWLDLDLVVDVTASMTMWQPLARELRDTLAESGVFRTVRMWRLEQRGDGGLSVRAAAPGAVPRSPFTILNATGRQAVLVLSDCGGVAWWRGPARALVREWGRRGPVAVVQPLPERLWDRSALPTVVGTTRPVSPGAPNTAIGFVPLDHRCAPLPACTSVVPVPVLEPAAGWLANWARLVAGTASSDLPFAMALVGLEATSPAPIDVVRPITVVERVARFQQGASTEAVRLASHLAITVPTLPVMRLVHRAVIPSPKPVQLAEVILSGLLRPVPRRPSHYEFVDGATELLLGSLRRSEAWQTVHLLNRIATEIESRAGRAREEFRALLARPGEGTRARPDASPFALVSDAARRRLLTDATSADDDPGTPAARSELPPVEPPGAAVATSRTRRVAPATVEATPLFGRTEELERIVAAVRDVGTGGGCVVLSGQPGIGKSRLMRFAADHARELGYGVAFGRAAELDRAAPLSTLQSVLNTAQPDSIDLSVLRGHEGRFSLIDYLGEVLKATSAQRPLLIALDDAQWTDELSALALRVLAGSREARVLWLLARRRLSNQQPIESPGQYAVDVLVAEGADDIHLAALDSAAVRALCAHTLAADVDDSVMRLAGRARGNPFLLEQLLLALKASNRITTARGVATALDGELPPNFVTAVDQRLQGLSASARNLLRCGSVLGRPFTVYEAARLAGCASVDLLPGVDEALATEILVASDSALAFAHDLLRQAVYDHTPSPVRAAMHRDAALIVRAEGRSVVEVAEHFVRSGVTGDAEAVETIRLAANEVAARAPGTAADFIVRALHMVGEGHPDRPALSAQAVNLLAVSGENALAREIGEAALLNNLDPAIEATTLLGLAEALKHAGQNATAVRYIERALARPGVPDRIQAMLHAVKGHSSLWNPELSTADQAGAEAERLGMASGEYAAAVIGLTARSVVARAEGRLTDALVHAERAVAIADGKGGDAAHRHPRIWLGAALCVVDRFDEAMVAYASGRRESEQSGTRWSTPLWHNYRAAALFAVGDLDAATVEVQAGQRSIADVISTQMSMPLLSLLTRIAVIRDELPKADGYLRQMRALAKDGLTAAPEDLAWAAALFHEAAGRPAEAMAALEFIFDRLPDRLHLLTGDQSSAAGLVRIALAAGDQPRAQTAADAALLLAGRNPNVLGLLASAHHCRGLLAGDVRGLRAAVVAYSDSPRRLSRALVREDCALAEIAAGNPKAGTELLLAAAHEYRECGAFRPLARCERRLDSLSDRAGPRPSVAALTSRELAVARLIARGNTTAEIAERLELSTKTVGVHELKIRRKLGARDRTELTRLLTSIGSLSPSSDQPDGS